MFTFKPPPPLFFAWLLGLLLGYLVLGESAKRFFYRHLDKRPRHGHS
ncbi:MAG: hypothetical protein H0W48_01125 [Methylibium sp.]|nr:hypothetical protein [Methylibium sp.]